MLVVLGCDVAVLLCCGCSWCCDVAVLVHCSGSWRNVAVLLRVVGGEQWWWWWWCVVTDMWP
jgi:hypothetical protein